MRGAGRQAVWPDPSINELGQGELPYYHTMALRGGRLGQTLPYTPSSAVLRRAILKTLEFQVCLARVSCSKERSGAVLLLVARLELMMTDVHQEIRMIFSPKWLEAV